jgi:hypothetical protein
MKSSCIHAAIPLGIVSLAVVLSGCGAAPDESTSSTEEALTTVTIKASAFGNWTNTGVRTSGSYLTGIVGGVQHMGYYVFDLTPVAGKTVQTVSFVANDPAGGSRVTITSPKPGLRTPIRPIGSVSIATLTGGNNNSTVFSTISREASSQDYTYDYVKAGTGNVTWNLLTYENTRIPDLIKAAKPGTQFAIASYANNFGSTAPVASNGSGDEFIFEGSGSIAPELVVTF